MEKSNENIHFVDATTIDISRRFDIYPKLVYSKFQKLRIDSNIGEKIYEHHTSLYNNFKESDNPQKTGKAKFLEIFDDLLKVYKSGNVAVTPIKTIDYKLINGLHRVSAALTYFSKIYARIDSKKEEGYKLWPYYKNNMLHEKDSFELLKRLDADYLGLQEFVKYVKDAKVLVLTPNCTDKTIIEDHLLKTHYLDKIIYKKSISLTKQGYLNLNNQLYGLEDWATYEKLVKHTEYCSSDKSTGELYNVDLYVINLTLDEALELKSSIRKTFHKTQHLDYKTTCHINDTYEETVNLVRSLFSESSEKTLNTMRFADAKIISEKYRSFKHTGNNLVSDISDAVVISGSSALSIFGLRREPHDVDLILSETIDYKSYCRNRQNCGSYNYYEDVYLGYFDVKTFDDLVYNPAKYFWMYGLKFTKPEIVLNMKQNRYMVEKSEKDKNDYNDFVKNYNLQEL